MMKSLWEWIKSFLVAVIIVAIIGVFLGTTTVVHGSMNPTLREGDILVIYKQGGIRRGDIVTFKSRLRITEEDLAQVRYLQKLFVSVGDQKTLIKRIVGMPGDHLEIRAGQVYINQEPVEETYVQGLTPGDINIESIPDGKYFVMGDNREYSLDSRSEKIGLVDLEDITGRVMLRIYPLSAIELFRGF